MKLSVVIPVYNEADTLAILVERVCKVPMDKEILLIDDGSPDGCDRVVAELATREGIEAHYHQVNRGKGAAVANGLMRQTSARVRRGVRGLPALAERSC